MYATASAWTVAVVEMTPRGCAMWRRRLEKRPRGCHCWARRRETCRAGADDGDGWTACCSDDAADGRTSRRRRRPGKGAAGGRGLGLGLSCAWSRTMLSASSRSHCGGEYSGWSGPRTRCDVDGACCGCGCGCGCGCAGGGDCGWAMGWQERQQQ